MPSHEEYAQKTAVGEAYRFKEYTTILRLGAVAEVKWPRLQRRHVLIASIKMKHYSREEAIFRR